MKLTMDNTAVSTDGAAAEMEPDRQQDGNTAEGGYAPRVDESVKSHWSDLKGRGFKAYLEYFWEYYRIPVIIIAAVLILGGTLIHDIVTGKPSAFNAVVINAADYSNELPESFFMEEDDVFDAKFAEYAGIDTDEYIVTIDRTVRYSVDDLSGMAMTTAEKIFAEIAAGDLDVMLCDQGVFHSYARTLMYADLRDVMPQSELEEYDEKGLVYYIDRAEVEAVEEAKNNNSLDTFTWDSSQPMKDAVPVGIRLKAAANGAPGGVMGIVVNSKHIDEAVAFIRYIVVQ